MIHETNSHDSWNGMGEIVSALVFIWDFSFLQSTWPA